LDKKSFLMQNGGEISIGAAVLVALYLTSLQSYILFHSIIELFTIVVAGGVFVIVWNARGYMNNHYLLFIGIASIFVAFVDLLHTLAYQGMGVFGTETSNLATQLWVAARYLQCLSWLIAPFFLGRRLRVELQVGAYALVTGILLLSIFYWQNFPVAYVEGVGLTAFKKDSEYVVSAVFVAAIVLLIRRHQAFDRRVWQMVVVSLGLRICAELTFTSYVSVFGPANMIGHMLRLIAFYFLYKAIIQTGLVMPYSILLRDLKRTDDQLRDYAATLEARNTVLMCADERLREEGAALKARNEELDAYAHSVAHDLKNPLTTIIAASDVITQVGDLTSGELHGFLRQIKSTAFDMDSIVDSLLLLSEVRKVEAPLAPVDMDKVVGEVHRRLDHLIKEYHGHLICPANWPTAIGYGPWIAEVWTNYISNALKYGGPSPRVEVGADPGNAGMIRFWTRDHGPGVPQEVRAGLFTPFTKRRSKGGHGLGLSIVLRIVHKLGGEVGVESQVGKGSEFYFTLPEAAPASTESEAPEEQGASQARLAATA
jgi:signal transduction histidine kinase